MDYIYVEREKRKELQKQFLKDQVILLRNNFGKFLFRIFKTINYLVEDLLKELNKNRPKQQTNKKSNDEIELKGYNVLTNCKKSTGNGAEVFYASNYK